MKHDITSPVLSKITREYSSSHRSRRLAEAAHVLFWLVALLPSSSLASASPGVQELLTKIYTQPNAISFQPCEQRTCLTVSHQELSKAQKSEIAQLARRLSVEKTQGRTFCFFRGRPGRAELVAQTRLDKESRVELSGLVPGFNFTGFGMALDLRMAGLSDESANLSFDVAAIEQQPNGRQVLNEIFAMVRAGQVVLRAQLSRPPAKDRTTIARIPTDRGPLGIKVLMSEALGLTPEDKVVFSTPGGRSFAVPLGEFPSPGQVISNLTTTGGLLKSLTLTVPAGQAKGSGFFLEFTPSEVVAEALAVRTGVAPLDNAGRLVGASMVAQWTPTLRVQRTMSETCEYEVSFDLVGASSALGAFALFYPEDERNVASLLKFDPAVESVGTELQPETLCGPNGEVR